MTQHSDWLRLRLMDQSQEILLGHAIFVSSEYGYHAYRRSISNKSIFYDDLLYPVSYVKLI